MYVVKVGLCFFQYFALLTLVTCFYSSECINIPTCDAAAVQCTLQLFVINRPVEALVAGDN